MSTTRGVLISTRLDLVSEDCCECGVTFAMPADMHWRLVNNPGSAFYCPNGHSQHYVGKSEAQKQQERAEQAEQRLKWAEARESAQRRERQAAERSARAYKGHLTRMRNRIANGVCPVGGCRRNFANVKAHITSQHPDWAHEHPEALS